MLGEVEEGVVGEEIALECIRGGIVDLLIGGDASTTVDCAAGVGQLDLTVSVVWLPGSRT